jgi:hypothetical protein
MKPEEQLSVALVLLSMMVDGISSNSWTVPFKKPKAGRPSPSYEIEMAFKIVKVEEVLLFSYL